MGSGQSAAWPTWMSALLAAKASWACWRCCSGVMGIPSREGGAHSAPYGVRVGGGCCGALRALNDHHLVLAEAAGEGVGLAGQPLVAAGPDGRVARAELAEEAPVFEQGGDGRLLVRLPVPRRARAPV